MGNRFVAALCLAGGLGSGCAWVFQDHLPSDYQTSRHAPRCSASPGWQVLDGIFAVGNGLTAAAEIANNNRTDEDTFLLVTSIGWTLIHTLSLSSGHSWANECEDALREYDESPPPRERAPAASPMPVASAEVEPQETALPEAGPPRKIVHGAKPVFCAIERDDADRGVCFLQESACVDARAKAPDAYAECASRLASACFNATTVIDGKRLTVCSVTVKDCERQRTKMVSDPDFGNVGTQCGVYRADGAPQPSEAQP